MAFYEIGDVQVEYDVIYYCDSIVGSDSGTGAEDAPFSTMEKVFTLITENKKYLIVLGEGSYNYRAFTQKSITAKVIIVGEGLNTSLTVNEGFYSNSSNPSRISFDFYKLRWNAAGAGMTPNFMVFSSPWRFYNVLFENIPNNEYSYFNPRVPTGSIDMFNCVKPVTSTSLFTAVEGTIKLTNCYGAFTSGYNTTQASWDFQTNLITSSTSLDDEFNITAGNWENAGTGTNLDGSRAHIGLYGGFATWEVLYKLNMLSLYVATKGKIASIDYSVDPRGNQVRSRVEIDQGAVGAWTPYSDVPYSTTGALDTTGLSEGMYNIFVSVEVPGGRVIKKATVLKITNVEAVKFESSMVEYRWDGENWAADASGNTPQEVNYIPKDSYLSLPMPVKVVVVTVDGSPPKLRTTFENELNGNLRAGEYSLNDGHYTSPVLDTGYITDFKTLAVTATPNGNVVKIETRTFYNGTWTDWLESSVEGSILSPGGSRFQYRVYMKSKDGVSSPTLTKVELDYTISDKEILDASMARIAEDLKQTKIALAKMAFHNNVIMTGQRQKFNNITIEKFESTQYLTEMVNTSINSDGEVVLNDPSVEGYVVLDTVQIPSYSYYTLIDVESQGEVRPALSFDFGSYVEAPLDEKVMNPDGAAGVRVKLTLPANSDAKLRAAAILV